MKAALESPVLGAAVVASTLLVILFHEVRGLAVPARRVSWGLNFVGAAAVVVCAAVVILRFIVIR